MLSRVSIVGVVGDLGGQTQANSDAMWRHFHFHGPLVVVCRLDGHEILCESVSILDFLFLLSRYCFEKVFIFLFQNRREFGQGRRLGI